MKNENLLKIGLEFVKNRRILERYCLRSSRIFLSHVRDCRGCYIACMRSSEE